MKTQSQRPRKQTRQATEPKPVRISRKERQRDLEATVDLCFTLLGDRGIREIAGLTRLSKTTIHNLRNGKFSLNCRINTLQSLAFAAGLRLTFTETDVRIILI